ncbi:hypothetical protein TNCV_3946521 [Trichonephila clavipes]|nr:hypothetical protein TNCV_3946521 [Trichonephila clavipes]
MQVACPNIRNLGSNILFPTPILMSSQSWRQISYMRYRTFSSFHDILYIFSRKQVASGILVGIKNDLTADIRDIKEIRVPQDQSKIARLRIWCPGYVFQIYALYIPPDCKPEHFNYLFLRKQFL